MSPVATTFKNPTGKQNLKSSLFTWLSVNVPTAGPTDFTYFMVPNIATAVFPRVEINEFQFFSKGSGAFGEVLFPQNDSGQPTEGVERQAMFEINIFFDIAKDTNATQKIYQIRDRLVYGLSNAGRSKDADDTQILPAIAVLDYNVSPTPTDTNTVARIPIEEDNWSIERYFAPTSEAPNVLRYQILFKIYWYELN